MSGDIAKDIIMFIRQNAFLPENDNLQHVTNKIEAEVLRGRIDTLEDCKIKIEQLSPDYSENAKAIFEALNERYDMRIATLNQKLKELG